MSNPYLVAALYSLDELRSLQARLKAQLKSLLANAGLSGKSVNDSLMSTSKSFSGNGADEVKQELMRVTAAIERRTGTAPDCGKTPPASFVPDDMTGHI